MLFGFRRQKRIEGTVTDLVVESRRSATPANCNVESIIYRIYLHGSSTVIGECDLRLGMNEELYYAGNIGYRIYEDYRGHGFAYEAARLLFDIARDEYGMTELLLTCSPDNIASVKTLHRLNGELIETVMVPRDHWLYHRGETIKEVYRFIL